MAAQKAASTTVYLTTLSHLFAKPAFEYYRCPCIIGCTIRTLQARLSSWFVRQNNADQPSRNEKSSTSIHRRIRLKISSNGDDRRHNTEDSICRSRESISGSSIFGWKDLWSISV